MAAELENDAPAIKALGSLFKLTQVFLWDDSFAEPPEISSSSTHTDLSANRDFHPDATYTSSKLDSAFKGFTRSLEDMELTQQMNALGLPVSFNTSKKGSVMTKAKRKGTQVKPKSGYEVNKGDVVDVSKVKDGEVVTPVNFHDKAKVSLCCITTLDRSETSYSDIAEEVCKTHCSSNGGSVSMEEVCEEITSVVESCSADPDIIPCEIVLNGDSEVVVCPIHEDGEASSQNSMQVSPVDKPLLGNRSLEGSFMAYNDSKSENTCVDITTEEPCIPDSGVSSHSSILTNHVLKDEHDNCMQCGDFGDWRAFWDSFYMRNYFYNIKTHESTWYPPPGFEYIAFSGAEPEPSDMIVDTAEKDIISGVSRDEVLNPCDLQDKSHYFEKYTSSNNSSVHSSHETSSGIHPDAGNAISGPDLATINCSYKDSDKLSGLTSFSEIKKNPDGEASSYSVSNTEDDINSLGQLGSEEDWKYDLQNTFTNSKTDQLDTYEQFSKVEKVISCEDTHRMCDMGTNKVSDSSRLTPTMSEVSEENWNEVQLEYMSPAIDDLKRQKDPVRSKKKKKVRRTRQRRLSDYNTELQFDGMPEEFPDDIVKYWRQRYSLFSRFDDGIKMDEEAWFSVTPEPIAVHHAARCGGGIVIDSFTGVGGNAIQLAKSGSHVIAIDIDPQKIEYAQHNASIYGVDGNIDFIKGDFFQLALKMKADVVLLSPPWGGPDYSKVPTYNINTMLKPHDGYFLFHTSRGIASRIVMFLPRNVDLNQLAELSLSVHPPWTLEVEKNFLNGKLKAITAYFTDTAV